MNTSRHKIHRRWAIIGFVMSAAILALGLVKTEAAAGINQAIPFQGKVVNSNGTNVTDGTYDFVFKLYDSAASTATNTFTESWTAAALWGGTMTTAPASGGESLTYSSDTNESTIKVGQILTNTTKVESVVVVAVNTSTNVITISPTRQSWATTDTVTNKIYVKDGIFQVNLNTLNVSFSGVDFNTDNIFLGINFNADGEMKPRVQYAAVPYAMNALKVSGLTVSNTSGTFTLANSKTLTVNNTLAFSGTDGTTFTFPGSTDTVVTLTATQTLTNKTLTSPTIQGTVGAGSGLTLPAFTAGGDITGSGLTIYGSSSSAGNLTLASTSHATKGKLLFGTSAYDEVNNRLGLATASPGSTLDVKGTLRLSGSTSGYVGLSPAAVAGSTTYTLPSADGSDGQFLKTNGTGTLSWGTASGSGTVDNALSNGRLTLTTVTPVTTSDVTAATTVYFSPYKGNRVSLYDGAAWITDTFSEVSIKLTDTQTGSTTNASAVVTGLTDTAQFIAGMQVTGTGIPASTTISTIDSGTQVTLNNNATATGSPSLTFKVAGNKNLDLFAYDSAGSPKLEMVAWTSDTARATALTLQNGVNVKSGATTRRYLGTVRTTATAGQTEDSATKRYVWNVDNRIAKTLLVRETAASWTYATANVWRQVNANTANKVEVVVGLQEDRFSLQAGGNLFSNGNGATSYSPGIGIDSTTTNSADLHGGFADSNGGAGPAFASYRGTVAVGYHAFNWIEDTKLENGGTLTIYGNNGSPVVMYAALSGEGMF